MNFTKIKPLLNRVLVKRIVAPTKTHGGILLPEKTGNPLKLAVVEEVGPGRNLPNGVLITPTLKAGDSVLLPDYGGVKVPRRAQDEQSAEYLIFQEEDILGVVSH